MAECDCVASDAECWAPFFGDGFGEACYAGFAREVGEYELVTMPDARWEGGKV